MKLTIPMLIRAEQLRRAGLSYKAVATVIELDFGYRPKIDTLRRNLWMRGVPKDTRRDTTGSHFREAA